MVGLILYADANLCWYRAHGGEIKYLIININKIFKIIIIKNYKL